MFCWCGADIEQFPRYLSNRSGGWRKRFVLTRPWGRDESGKCNAIREKVGGRGRDRTGDPLLAKQMLSQLSYTPNPIFNFEACEAVGQGRGLKVIRGCLRAILCGGTSTKLEACRSEMIHSELLSPPAAMVSSTRLGLYPIALDSNSVSGKLSPFVPAPTWLEAARVLKGPSKEGS
jgi:hypothetical protein